MSNEEFELGLAEIMSEIRKCQKNGFKREPVLFIIKLIEKLYRATEDESKRTGLTAILDKVILRRKEEKEREESGQATGVPGGIVTTGGLPPLDQILPLASPRPYNEALICNTTIIDRKKLYSDNVFLIYSPYVEELDWLVECFASENSLYIRTVDFEILKNSYPSELSNIMTLLCNHAKSASNELIVYKNVSSIGNDDNLKYVFSYYLGMMRKEVKNIMQLILSDDPGYGIEAIYKERASEFYKNVEIINSYLKSLDFYYMPIPTHTLVLAKISQKFDIPEGDITAEVIAKDGIYLGYKGINDLLASCSDLSEVRAFIEATREKREKKFVAFLDSLANPLAFSTEDWSFKYKKKQTQEAPNPHDPIFHRKFSLQRDQYDSLITNEEIYSKMEKLLNYENVSLRLKCAWAAHFALDAGDTLNLTNLPPEVVESRLKERWGFAYKAVCELLLLDVGELVFDIPAGKTLLGQCCDGGRTIRMNEKYIDPKKLDKLSDGVSTLLHELFHALQFKSIEAMKNNSTDILGYYLVHLGIKNEIVEWEKNNRRYRSPEKSFEDYEDQVFEAAARVFSADCLDEYGNFSTPRL